MTNQYLWQRVSGPDSNLRAGDADRERIAERLRKSHADGRLDLAEFQERLERCYAAKTFGELRELVRDLPRRDESERRSFGASSSWRRRLAPLAPILIALLVVSAATGHHHVLWLWLPLVFLFWRMTWWRHGGSLAGARRGPGDRL